MQDGQQFEINGDIYTILQSYFIINGVESWCWRNDKKNTESFETFEGPIAALQDAIKFEADIARQARQDHLAALDYGRELTVESWR